jgi:ATP-binding cassette, subfamily C (CFTR/MRP), member 1
MTAEDREVGTVNKEVYIKWAMAGGGLLFGVLIVLSYIGAELIAVTASWWLSYWSENRDNGTPWFYLGIYIVINMAVIGATLAKEIELRLCGWRAAEKLFKEMLEAVLYAPMSFFDTTPMGRITNRFSKVYIVYSIFFKYILYIF